jgi:hypothetical protein
MAPAGVMADVAPAAKASTPAAAADKAAAEGAADVPPATARKIIYNGRVTIVVESVASFGEQVQSLVAEAGGYISETDVTSATRTYRSARWTVRVPVDKFSGFVDRVSKLGEVEQSHVDSQDVTQEYYDVEARIANKQKEEKRLQKHLEESTGKLEDILHVERELSRVRGEIELMQGRIRYLANLSSLSTVTISASEVKTYTPPERPTFATRIGRTFGASVESLQRLCENVVLALVALAPWVPPLAVLAILVAFLVRRIVRRQTVELTRAA